VPLPPSSPFRGSSLVWTVLPFLVAAWVRFHGIGDPEPFVDESGNILTALDPRVHEYVDPLGQGRPILAGLFAPAGWFPTHVLEVARLMTALAGLASMAALGWTLHRLAGRTASLGGLWLWALMPFAVFHERLALQDPFVTALLAWAAALMLAGCLGSANRRWAWFGGAGLLFGLAFLCKISAILALPWLGILYVLTQLHLRQPVFCRPLLGIVAGALLPLLCLGPDLLKLGQWTAHSESFPTFAADKYGPLVLGHWLDWSGWYAGYGGWPLALLALGAVFGAAKAGSRLIWGCALAALGAFAVAVLFYNRPFARYGLPDHVPLVLFLALGWARLFAQVPHRLVLPLVLAFGLLVARWGWVSRQIATDPLQAPVPADDISQYFTGPWSGHGVDRVTRYLAEYADRHHVRCWVVTHRFARPGNYGLMLAELGDPRLSVLPFTVYDQVAFSAVHSSLREGAAREAVACFLLYEGNLYPPPAWLDEPGSPARKIAVIPRHGDEAFTLYQFAVP